MAVILNYRGPILSKYRFLKTVTWGEVEGRGSLNSVRVVPEIPGGLTLTDLHSVHDRFHPANSKPSLN